MEQVNMQHIVFYRVRTKLTPMNIIFFKEQHCKTVKQGLWRRNKRHIGANVRHKSEKQVNRVTQCAESEATVEANV